ncbi:NAD(P)/FAD-dependent oxidoreductase [Actinomycetota bacterium Odt1-20B]
MATAVIVGGSVAGLACALALSGTGYRVLVLDQSPEPPAGPLPEAALRWRRPSVPQADHPHTLGSLGVQVLRERAPLLLSRLRAAGALEADLTHALPATATDRARRPADDELVALACRRTTFELVLRRHVAGLPDVGIRPGVTVDALELDSSARRVRAVVTRGGARIPATLVVDATGHRAKSRTWLRDCGVPVAADLVAPSGLDLRTRFHRLRQGWPPATAPTGDLTAYGAFPAPFGLGHGVGAVWDHYAALLHPADGGTFSVTLGTLPGDRALSALVTTSGFTAAATATPGLAPWLTPDVSAPLTEDISTLTCPPNSFWGVASSRQHPVAGLFQTGDAACVTNPLLARGMSLALAHAFRLADVLAAHPDVDTAQRRAAARMTEDFFLPWYEQSAASDRTRITRWRAALSGTPQPDAPGPDEPPAPAQVTAAARQDGVVWRGLTRMLMTLTTEQKLHTDEEFLTRVHQTPPTPDTRPRPPGRADLLRHVHAAERHTTALATPLPIPAPPEAQAA